ncbi:hypothetical protein ACH4PU_30630 [Streptomyces sp. NPDC021100]|uniref:hypothetical protein n=1 Tax=Streptomyces sp. NPDC021100 TaxID=3365114 RepID=UPI00378BA291
MTGRIWTVEVPARHRSKPLTGWHVFTGTADNGEKALSAARRAYEIALLHQAAGHDIPAGHRFGDWTARGLRADWDLDWTHATKLPFHSF